MKHAPPTSAPSGPRSRHAQKIASWVEAGPGSILVAAMPSSNSAAEIHPRCSTHSVRSSAMWAAGPPNPMQPMRPHSRAIVSSGTRSVALGVGTGSAGIATLPPIPVDPRQPMTLPSLARAGTPSVSPRRGPRATHRRSG